MEAHCQSKIDELVAYYGEHPDKLYIWKNQIQEVEASLKTCTCETLRAFVAKQVALEKRVIEYYFDWTEYWIPPVSRRV